MLHSTRQEHGVDHRVLFSCPYMLYTVEWTIQKVYKGALWQENENN